MALAIMAGNIALLVFVLAVNIRSAWALHKAHQQRMDVIIARMFRPITHGTLQKAIEAVSFRKHAAAVFWGRDPWALYDPIVRDAIENPRTEVLGAFEMHQAQAERPRLN